MTKTQWRSLIIIIIIIIITQKWNPGLYKIITINILNIFREIFLTNLLTIVNAMLVLKNMTSYSMLFLIPRDKRDRTYKSFKMWAVVQQSLTSYEHRMVTLHSVQLHKNRAVWSMVNNSWKNRYWAVSCHVVVKLLWVSLLDCIILPLSGQVTSLHLTFLSFGFPAGHTDRPTQQKEPKWIWKLCRRDFVIICFNSSVQAYLMVPMCSSSSMPFCFERLQYIHACMPLCIQSALFVCLFF